MLELLFKQGCNNTSMDRYIEQMTYNTMYQKIDTFCQHNVFLYIDSTNTF